MGYIMMAVNLYSNLKSVNINLYDNYKQIQIENLRKLIFYTIDNNIYIKYRIPNLFEFSLCSNSLNEIIIYYCEKLISEIDNYTLFVILITCIKYQNYEIIDYYIKNNIINSELKSYLKQSIDDPRVEATHQVKEYLIKNNVL